MKKKEKVPVKKSIIIKKPRLPKRVLTGKELKIAAEKRLKVYYIEHYYNPLDKHLNFKGECYLEKANIGYYVGNSDINPEDFKDGALVMGDFFEGYYEVCVASKVRYV